MDAGGGVSDHCGRHIDCLFVTGSLKTRLHHVWRVTIGSVAGHLCPLANVVSQFKLQFDDSNVTHPDGHCHSDEGRAQACLRVCRREFGLWTSQHFITHYSEHWLINCKD